MIEGTLYRILWRRFVGMSNYAPVTGSPHESYLYECSGRRSINAGTWYHSLFTHFRFFNQKDQPIWLSVLVEEVEEVSLDD